MAHLAGAPEPDLPSRGLLPLPVMLLLCAACGALATFAALELWSAMATAERPLLWWTGRALGFVAYVALWLSMVCGALVSSGGAGGVLSKKWAMDLHQEWTLAAVVATALHVAVLVTHAESHVTPWAAVIPFVSETLTVEVALGTLAAIGLGVIAVTSWLRTRLPYTAWRSIHALSFGVMMLALAHGITAGTDTEAWAAGWLYVASTGALTAVMALRIGLALLPSRRPAG